MSRTLAQKVQVAEGSVQAKGATPPRAATGSTSGAPYQLARVPAVGSVIQRREDGGGLPGALKTGIESLSGHSLHDVRVHYGSSEPATLNAHAYARGNEIHLAPGQERHLPHEAWHLVQQRQGRVKPTAQLKGGVPVNEDVSLEREADEMGQRALHHGMTLAKV